MEQVTKLTILLILMITLNSCGTIKEGFVSKKKNSTDEFLVKKKSPLVMPPNFNELPIPENLNQEQKNHQEKNALFVGR